MKKNCFNKIVNIFFLITAVLFASCSDLSIVDELDDTGTISISVAESNARMVLPTLDVEHFTDFELKGTLGSGTQENIKTWSTYSDFSSGKDNVKIKTGNWTFVFTCNKGGESFSGTTTATITAGGTPTNLSFELNHTQTSEKGTVNFSFQWPENTVKTVVYYLKDVNSSSAPEPVVVSADSNNKLERIIDNLDAGNYCLDAYFYSLNVTAQDLSTSSATLNTALLDEVVETVVVESGLTTKVNHNLIHLKPVTYLQLKDSDGSAIDLNKKYDYKDIQLNDNWHIKVFNEYPKVISVKSVTANSITFTVNYANHEMVQVIFGDKPYELGKNYEVSYKSYVDQSVLSTCMYMYATEGQNYTYSNYNNYINTIKFTSDSTSSGSFLFFLPSAVGEYTIYDMQIADSDGFVYVEGSTVTGGTKFTNNGKTGVFVQGRTVTLSDFYICNHEVTQREFYDVMGVYKSYYNNWNRANLPAEQVSWYAAIAYCNKRSIAEGLNPCYTVSGITDWENLEYNSIPTSINETWDAVTCDFTANGYRLPTEAEWEYAALGGKIGVLAEDPTDFAGTNSSTDLANYAWYGADADDSDYCTHNVKTKLPNALGLYDMSGNVYEYCWDWVSSITAETPVTGASSGSYRVARGGSFLSPLDGCSVAAQGRPDPIRTLAWFGLRVVRTAIAN